MVESVTIQNSEGTGPTLEEQAAAQEAAAAAAKGEEPKLHGEAETPERPEWLPEKFKSPEDMAKAYAELEKAQSKGETPKADEAAGEANAAAEEAANKAGLDMEALSAEYATNGELTQESLDALAAVGITPEMVDMYIAGQEAQAAAVEADLLEPLGGSKETYDELTAWAADNLTDTEIDNFNTILDGGNNAAVKLAIQNLNQKYIDANGSEPGRVLQGKTGEAAGSVYESTADLMKDMNNPEYATNEAFRAKVAKKLERSSIL